MYQIKFWSQTRVEHAWRVNDLGSHQDLKVEHEVALAFV